MAFFDHFRRRVDAVRQMPGDYGCLSPDQNILVGAGLDALAKHWEDQVGKQRNHRTRAAEFLERHGGHGSFARVSRPYLVHQLHEAKSRNAGRVSDAAYDLAIDAVRAPVQHGRIWSWIEDPRLSDVVALPQIDAHPHLATLASEARYGALLYREHRCAWVHASDPGAMTDYSVAGPPTNGEPHYVGHRIVFPSAFLIRVYGDAVDSFERECLARGWKPPK